MSKQTAITIAENEKNIDSPLLYIPPKSSRTLDEKTVEGKLNYRYS